MEPVYLQVSPSTRVVFFSLSPIHVTAINKSIKLHNFKNVSLTPASHCKRKQGVSSAEAVRMQSRSSARPLPFHTGSVCSARLNSVFCTEWANSNLILNTIGLDLLE